METESPSHEHDHPHTHPHNHSHSHEEPPRLKTVTFAPLQSWIACVRAGYIYKIDYPVFDVSDPSRIQYGVLRYKMFEMEMIDLGRHDNYELAAKACQDHADADP